MATAKKPATTAKRARAVAGPKATAKERADLEVAMQAVDAIRERAKAASSMQPSDLARIKKLYAKLAKDALGAITKDSLGKAVASNKLHIYAERHAAWIEATAEALKEKTAVSARKADARFKKLEQLHNNFVWSAVRDEHGDVLEKLKKLALKGKAANDAAFKKLNAEQEDLIAKALKANGIGARNIFNY